MHDEIATMIAAIKVLLAKFQQDLAALEDRHAADRDAALPRGHHTALGMTAQDDSGGGGHSDPPV